MPAGITQCLRGPRNHSGSRLQSRRRGILETSRLGGHHRCSADGNRCLNRLTPPHPCFLLPRLALLEIILGLKNELWIRLSNWLDSSCESRRETFSHYLAEARGSTRGAADRSAFFAARFRD